MRDVTCRKTAEGNGVFLVVVDHERMFFCVVNNLIWLKVWKILIIHSSKHSWSSIRQRDIFSFRYLETCSTPPLRIHLHISLCKQLALVAYLVTCTTSASFHRTDVEQIPSKEFLLGKKRKIMTSNVKLRICPKRENERERGERLEMFVVGNVFNWISCSISIAIIHLMIVDYKNNIPNLKNIHRTLIDHRNAFLRFSVSKDGNGVEFITGVKSV